MPPCQVKEFFKEAGSIVDIHWLTGATEEKRRRNPLARSTPQLISLAPPHQRDDQPCLNCLNVIAPEDQARGAAATKEMINPAQSTKMSSLWLRRRRELARPADRLQPPDQLGVAGCGDAAGQVG